jgi:hypothetical protein
MPSEKELHELFDLQQCHPLASQQSATVCVTPAISLAGPGVWIRDADGLSMSIMNLGTGEVRPAKPGENAVVLPVRKSSYE